MVQDRCIVVRDHDDKLCHLVVVISDHEVMVSDHRPKVSDHRPKVSDRRLEAAGGV